MSDLPKGWKKVPLQDLVIFALGGDWGKDCNEKLENYVRVKVVRGTEFRNWKTQRAKTAAERCVKKSSLESRNLTEGDIVVEISGGGPTQPVGRTIIIDQKALESSDAPLVCSNFFRQVKLHDSIESSFVNYFLNFTWAKGGFDEFQTQTTNLRNLNFTQFLNETLVTLPPINEQKRIVEKLEKLLGKVEAAQARLNKIPAILKRFRQAVLAAACSGKLTTDWRLENIQSTQIATSSLILDEELLFEIPSNWRWVRLGSEANFINGDRGTNYPNRTEYVPTGIPFINTGHIKPDGSLNAETMHHLTTEKFNSLRGGKIQKGDLVYCLRGATLGKTAMVEPYTEGAIASSLVIIRPKDNIVQKYVYYFLISTYTRELIERFENGSAQPNLGADSVKQFIIPLPPIEEQKEIVRRVEDLFKFADQIEARYKKARIYTDKLTQSILAKAFRGELVPQDETDEPASVLLERIKAERTETKPANGSLKARKMKASNQPSLIE